MPAKGQKTPLAVRKKQSAAAKRRRLSLAQRRKHMRAIKTNESIRQAKAASGDRRFPESCIYILAMKRYPGLYKIGTANDPGERSRMLRAFLPHDHSRLVAYVRVKGAYKKELELVDQFPSNGELVRAELGDLLGELRKLAKKPVCLVHPLWSKNHTKVS